MKDHPASGLFPLLDDAGLRSLAEDIRVHGLVEPGVIFDGELLDGRNRRRACAIAGVDFRTRTLAQCRSPAAYVLSANLHRRHLTAIQRAALAVRVEAFFAEEARERQRTGKSADGAAGGRGRKKPSVQNAPEVSEDAGRARARAARSVGAGVRGAAVLSSIRRSAPDVFAAVEAGALGRVSDAAAVARLPGTQRAEVLRRVSGGAQAKVAMREARAEAAAEAVASAKRETNRYRLVCGPVADAAGHIEAGSVDLILTDPPYSREAVASYADLACFAAHALRPGGSLLVMAGQSYLPDVLAALGSVAALTYQWTLAYLTPGGQSPSVWARAVNSFWKPILWFVRAGAALDGRRGDVIRSDVNANEKDAHEWQQSESGFARLVEGWSAPGETVCDPFCGGGTTGVVALRLGRRFVGLDRDAAAVDVTLERLVRE